MVPNKRHEEDAFQMKDGTWIVECGCCSFYHREEYYGDCRDDSERIVEPEAETWRAGTAAEWRD